MTISVQDPAIIIAGIRQFGLAPDGTDLRDLEAALVRKPQITEAEVRAMLRRECDAAGGQSAWADLHNVTPQYVCDVLKGKRGVGKGIADALGLRRVSMFEAPARSL